MCVTPLSPVLEESLNSADCPCIVLHIADETILKDFLIEKVNKALLLNEACLIVVPDHLDITVPAKILSATKLAHLCLFWEEEETISDVQLKRFGILNQLKALEVNSAELDHNSLSRRQLIRKIDFSLRGVNETIMDGHNFKSLLHQNKSIPPSYFSKSELSSQSNTSEFNEIIKLLDRLQGVYLPSFNFTDQAHYLSPESFLSPPNIGLVKEELEEYQKSIRQGICNLKEHLIRELSKTENAGFKEWDIWQKIYDQLQDLYFHCETDQSPKQFEKNVQDLLLPVYSFNYFVINDDILKNITWDNAPLVLERIEKKIKQYSTTIQNIQHQQISHLSPSNATIDIIRDEIKSIYQTIEKIESSRFLKLSKTPRPFQIIQLLEQLNILLQKLELTYNAIQDGAYIDFMLQLSQAHFTKSFEQFLFNHSVEKWSEIYRQISFDHIIKKYFDPNFCKLDDRISQHQDLISQNRDLIKKIIHNSWHKNKSIAAHDLEKKNTDLYKSLFQTETSTLTIKNVYYNDPHFLKSFYPILIARQKNLSSIMKNTIQWENVVYFNVQDITNEEFASISELANRFYITTKNKELVDRLYKNQKPVVFSTNEIKLSYAQPLSLLSRSQRYEEARALASNMLTVVNTFNVYQLKDKTIISVLDPSTENAILEGLNRDDLNMIYKDAQSIEQMVEALIDPETEILLLIENGLLNENLVSCLSWQSYLINLLNDAGIQVLDIKTSSLYTDYRNHMQEIIHRMNQPKKVEVDMKRQMTVNA